MAHVALSPRLEASVDPAGRAALDRSFNDYLAERRVADDTAHAIAAFDVAGTRLVLVASNGEHVLLPTGPWPTGQTASIDDDGFTLQVRASRGRAPGRVVTALHSAFGPALEITRFLAAAGYRHAPAPTAFFEVTRGDTPIASVAVVAAPETQTDARAHFRSLLASWLEEIAPMRDTAPPVLPPNDILTRALFPLPEDIVVAVGDGIRSMALLGMRVGEMHKLLARTHIESFAPETFGAKSRSAIAEDVQREFDAALASLEPLEASLPRAARDLATVVRTKVASVQRRLVNVEHAPEGGVAIRVHGNLTLEGARVSGDDFVLVGFGGDASRSLDERRAKASPFADVASLLRAIHREAAASLEGHSEQRALAPWVGLFYRAASASFLGGWLRAVADSPVLPGAPAVTRALLDLFVLRECVRELGRASARSDSAAIAVALEGIKDILETERKPGQMQTSRSFTPFAASVEARVEPSYLDPSSPTVSAFQHGTATHAHRVLGAHLRPDGVTEFAVWAPNVEQVAVVGDFNGWSAEAGILPRAGKTGLFAGLVRGATIGQRYAFRFPGVDGGPPHERADPFGHELEPGAGHATVLASVAYEWNDASWMARRSRERAVSVYEVDLGAFAKNATYATIAAELAERAKALGFTHVELTPSADAALGFFGASNRGTPAELMALVDSLHVAGIGVIFAWTPGQFPRASLATFDGGPTFESEDPVRAMHPSGMGQFDVARPEVRSFLLSSATFFAEELHADGLRIDGLAGILYLDHRRAPGTWSPNVHGGRENLEGVHFVRTLTETLKNRHPDLLLVADGSSAWPGTTRPAREGGLGFDLAFDASFFHDMEFYFGLEGAARADQRALLDLGSRSDALLAVAHEASSEELRLTCALAYAQPGRKLFFAGHGPPDGKTARVLATLNQLYREEPEDATIRWIDAPSRDRTTISFVRTAGKRELVVAANLDAQPAELVLPRGTYRTVFSTDVEASEKIARDGRLTLPALGAVFMEKE